MADSPPEASTLTGWAASAPAVATAIAASRTAYTAQKARMDQRDNGDGSLPSGNSRITATNRTRPAAHTGSSASAAWPNGTWWPRR
jgi:hypothetical protein